MSQITTETQKKVVRQHTRMDARLPVSLLNTACPRQPYDNAPMERYYNTLKAELMNKYNFQTDEELHLNIQEFAYLWYNQIRPHSYNQYMTPFEKRFHASIRQWCYKNA